MSEDKAKKVAQEYFLKKYNINATFANLGEVQIGEHQFVSTIAVNYQNKQYELCLNTANKPLCDNKVTIDKQEKFKKYDFADDFSNLELYFHEYYQPASVLDYQKQCYKFTVYAHTNTIPIYENKVNNYKVLRELESSGVDELCIIINSPKLLRDGTNGLQIESMVFETNLSETTFESKYKELVDSVYYDENKFNSILQILKEEGIKNPYFYATNYRNGNTLELRFHNESSNKNSIELIKSQLKKIDDSYIYVKDTKIGITISSEVNGKIEEMIYK